MYKIVALIGESGSGKDSVLREFLIRYPECHKIINHTSRPMREGEVQGVNYHYVSSEEFNKFIWNHDLVENACFNGWYYGTSKTALDENKINIGVFNPKGVEQLLENEDCDVLVLWVRTPPKERLLRQLMREQYPNVHEIVRRFSTDETDFYRLPFKFFEIPNQSFSDLLASSKVIMDQIERRFDVGQD